MDLHHGSGALRRRQTRQQVTREDDTEGVWLLEVEIILLLFMLMVLRLLCPFSIFACHPPLLF